MDGVLGPPTDTQGIEVSPTRIRKFRSECERRWGAPALGFAPPEPTTAALTFGSKMHKVAENWYRKLEAPDTSKVHGKLFASGMRLLPKPGPNVFSELPVKLPPVTLADGSTFEVPGTADLVEWVPDKRGPAAGCVVLYDYKSTKAEKWIKTVDELKADEQPNIYGLAVMNRFQVDWVRCNWVYFIKTGPPRAVPVEFTLTREHCERYWSELEPTVKRMLESYGLGGATRATGPEVFEANKNNCNAYGKKCPYAKDCERIRKMEAKTGADALFASLKAKKVKVKAVRDTPKTDDGIPDAQTQAEEAPQEAPQETPAASPGQALFAKLTAGSKATKAPPADPINAPEGAAPEAPPTEEAPKKKKRKKKKAMGPMESQTIEPQATTEAPEGPATSGTLPSAAPLVVCINALPTHGALPKAIPLSELARAAMDDAAAAESVPDWRLIDFKAAGVLAYHFGQWLADHGESLRGSVVYVDRFSAEGKALSTTLEQFASDCGGLVFRGV